MNKEDESLGRYGETISVRLTPATDFLIKQKAYEQKKSKSELIRSICMNFFENEIKDPELIYQSLEDSKSRIRFLENKVDLLSVMLLEQTKWLMKVLPEKTEDGRITEAKMEKFTNSVAAALRKNKGKLESIVLDIYQQGVD